MNIFLTALASQLVSIIPCHFLAYYPFRDHLRVRIWKIVVLIAVIQISTAVVSAFFAAAGTPRRELEFLTIPVFMLIFFASIRADKFKLLFLYVFVQDYMMIIRGGSAFLGAWILQDRSISLYVPAHPLIQVGILFASYPSMLRFFDSVKNKVLQIDAPPFWRTAWLVPAFNSGIVLMYTGAFTPEQVQSWQFLLARVLLLASMFLIYSSLLHSLDTVRKQAALVEKLAFQENLLAIQQTQYDQLLRHMEQIRTARHDLRHHWEALRAYLDAGDLDGLRSYLDAYGKKLPTNTQQLFCKNFAVNAVLNYYAEASHLEQTEFTARVELPEVPPVSEPELCALLGNLLENALDACRDITGDASRFIRVGGYADGNHVVITVDNACARVPAEENGRLLSSKHSGFGIGTSSVRSAAERTGGAAEFSCRDGMFCASVLLYGKKAGV